MGFLDRFFSKGRGTPAKDAKPAAPPVPKTAAAAPAAPAVQKPAAPAAAAPSAQKPAPVVAPKAAPVAVAKPAAQPVQKPAAPAPKAVAAPAPKPAAAPQRKAAPAAAKSSISLPFFGAAKPAGGPLRLMTGDFVTHYRERFAVVGTRVLEGDGATVTQYCLRNENGAAAVLAAEGGAEASLTLQRHVKADVKWDADELTGIGDAPVRVVRKSRMKVRAVDDAGIAANVRSVESRRFSDASGDLVVVLEDFQGAREIRVGEAVFEAEMEFERAAGNDSAGTHSAALAGAKAFEDAAENDIVKGTPRAAAKALEENMGAKKAAGKTSATKSAAQDPTGYDDDAWADAEEDVTASIPVRAAKPAKQTSGEEDEDEWVSATQLVRDGTGGDDEE